MVAGIVALSGCLKIPPSGVAVRAVTADLVFGVPPLPEPVAPPGFGLFEEEEEATPSPSPTGKRPKPPEPPKEPCPTAAEQTFPEEEASTSVRGLPKEGLYFWKSNLINLLESGGTVKGVGGARRTSPNNSEFRIGEVNVRGTTTSTQRFFVQEFIVIQDGGSGDGIFLTRMTQYRDLNDQTGTDFSPDPAIKIFPLPVRAGLTLGEGNAGVDGTSFAVLKQTGTVTGRKRVDVCGVVIDSWFVDGMQEYVAPTGRSYSIDYDYSVATHLGGFVAFERTIESARQITEERNIGRLEPFAANPVKQLGR